MPACNTSVHMYYQNIRSFKEGYASLRSLAIQNYSVISLTETWLTQKVVDTKLQLPLQGYEVFRKDRSDRKGGGVMLAVKRDLMPQRRPDLETDCECIVVQIAVMRGPSCLITTMYRPPDDRAALDEFYKCVGAVHATGHPAVFLGDFNLRYLKWDRDYETGAIKPAFRNRREVALSSKFVENLERHGLIQVVTEPTGQYNTFLDLVITNVEAASAVLCAKEFPVSDHHALRARLVLTQR